MFDYLDKAIDWIFGDKKEDLTPLQLQSENIAQRNRTIRTVVIVVGSAFGIFLISRLIKNYL